MDELPFEDASFDVVISNAAVNLSPAKHLVFAEAARVLRPGGRLAFADMLSAIPLKGSTRRNTELWAASIAGAIPRDAYADALEDAGFRITAIRRNHYRFTSEHARLACRKYGVGSTTIAAVRRVRKRATPTTTRFRADERRSERRARPCGAHPRRTRLGEHRARGDASPRHMPLRLRGGGPWPRRSASLRSGCGCSDAGPVRPDGALSARHATGAARGREPVAWLEGRSCRPRPGPAGAAISRA